MINWDHLPMVEPLSLKAAKDTYTAICPTVDASLEELLTQLDYVPLAIVLMAHIWQKGNSPKQLLNTPNPVDSSNAADCYAPCRSRPGPEFGSVGFGVRADVASASGSLRRLVFRVQASVAVKG